MSLPPDHDVFRIERIQRWISLQSLACADGGKGCGLQVAGRRVAEAPQMRPQEGADTVFVENGQVAQLCLPRQHVAVPARHRVQRLVPADASETPRITACQCLFQRVFQPVRREGPIAVGEPHQARAALDRRQGFVQFMRTGTRNVTGRGHSADTAVFQVQLQQAGAATMHRVKAGDGLARGLARPCFRFLNAMRRFCHLALPLP